MWSPEQVELSAVLENAANRRALEEHRLCFRAKREQPALDARPRNFFL
jgi:hypothetical protein